MVSYIMVVDMNNNNNDTAPSQVYLLHFKDSYWGNARHYVGYTTVGVDSRIEKHRNGNGSLLVNYAHNKLGIDFTVTMVENHADRISARQRERQLKREGHLSRHCKICRERRKAEDG
jgi:predicted GIY-YIG superfamily endonuclease